MPWLCTSGWKPKCAPVDLRPPLISTLCYLGMVRPMRVCRTIVATVLIGLILAPFLTAAHAENPPQFRVSIPSAEQEAAFVCSLMRNIASFDSNRYVLSMPRSDIVSVLLEKARRKELVGKDWNLLQKDIQTTVYDRTDYQNGYQAVADVLAIADTKGAVFQNYHEKWGFYLPPQYDIRLTLYGPGGSYDARTGTIVMLTTKEGGFKRGRNPLETILHEAVHIGIENTIVSKYGLSHWTKERIVDQFMMHHFKDVCPDYRMQPNAETGIDRIFTGEDVWDHLPERVHEYVSR
jgi:hypothetical protein